MADKASKIAPKLVDELLKGQDPQKVLSSEGLLGNLKKAWRSACWTPRWTFI